MANSLRVGGFMSMWISAQQLATLETMPSSPQGVNKKARTGNWEKRQVQGIRGVGYEYRRASSSSML